MSRSSIEWTMEVWNPTTGCNKVSPGCKNCYAEKMHNRLVNNPKMKDKYTRPFLDGAFPHEGSLYLPINWKKPKTIFVNSMSDLFHENLSDEFIAKVFLIMVLCRQHTFQVLTKRADRMFRFMNKTAEEFAELISNAVYETDLGSKEDNEQDTLCAQTFNYIVDHFPLPNIWLGTSCENQATAMERIPYLMDTPAAIRWISAEPLLGPINFNHVDGADKLDWIVVGGESGPKRRLFDTDWARQIRDYCQEMKVKFFMKQIDKIEPIPQTLMIREYPEKVPIDNP